MLLSIFMINSQSKAELHISSVESSTKQSYENHARIDPTSWSKQEEKRLFSGKASYVYSTSSMFLSLEPYHGSC